MDDLPPDCLQGVGSSSFVDERGREDLFPAYVIPQKHAGSRVDGAKLLIVSPELRVRRYGWIGSLSFLWNLFHPCRITNFPHPSTFMLEAKHLDYWGI